MELLNVKNLKKIYATRFGGNQVEALSNVTFSIEEGEFVAIMGESGSGKTTLLNILATLDKPTSGEVFLRGKSLLSNMGFMEMESKLYPIAERLGISKLLDKFPYEVSGGEKQRAAVARAIITEPEILLADEPTGALDSKSSGELLNIFSEINRSGQTILMVTHSTIAASHASRVLFIKDGEIFHQIYKGDLSNREMFEKISNTLTLLASGGKRDE